MRITMRSISQVSAFLTPLLAAVLLLGISTPAFASGGDKPAANGSNAATGAANSAARPDRERKVFTNDDLDRMWPKQSAPAMPASQSQIKSAAIPRAAASFSAPVPNERDPLWYAQQVAALTAELDDIAIEESRLRDFRASGATPRASNGLALNAPCDGYTTDNAIAQLAFRRQEIEQQIASLEDTAHRNDIPPAVIRDAPAIVAAAQRPLTPAEAQALLEERQAQLASALSATHAELSGMSAEAASIGANLQPPTPGFGGNMTTDLIQRLDNRAGEIQNALAATEDAARQAGAAQR